MNSTALFWHTLLVSAFQPKDSADPDGTPARMSVPVGTESPIYGNSPAIQAGDFNESAIYLETLRDMLLAGTTNTDEAHTVVHEIGHTGGNRGHTTTWLMMEGAPKTYNSQPNDHVDNESQAAFRSLSTW